MTVFYRRLSQLAPLLLSDDNGADSALAELIEAASYTLPETAEQENLRLWLRRYSQRLRRESCAAEAIRDLMLAANPKYVLRNYLAQNAIEAADKGDLSPLQTLMGVLRSPFAEQPEHEELAAKRPDWARDKPGCATLSCSS